MPAILQEHGIHAQLQAVMDGEGSTGERILHAAHQVGANLPVLGAFAHGERCEFIFGGVTRYMLAATDLPLFMRHQVGGRGMNQSGDKACNDRHHSIPGWRWRTCHAQKQLSDRGDQAAYTEVIDTCADGVSNGLITVSIAATVARFAEVALFPYPNRFRVGPAVGRPAPLIGKHLKEALLPP